MIMDGHTEILNFDDAVIEGCVKAEAIEVGVPKMTSASRKVNKKQSRVLDILKKDTGISESQEPTKVLFICNAGLVTGSANSDIVRIFSKFGPIQSVLMVPQKSYSFLVYHRLDSAQLAMETVHGKVGLSDSGPLYLAYVETLPAVKDPWRGQGLPPGIRIVADFVTEEEEQQLLDSFHWDQDSDLGSMKNRKVKHYGFEFNYKTNNIDPNLPLVDQPIQPLCQRVALKAYEKGLVDEVPDQLTVNRYLPGQGIPSHTDSHDCCTSSIISLSLNSGVTMDFRSPLGEHLPVWLPPRSLLIMAGEARYRWKHGISPRHCDTVPGHLLTKGEEGLTLATRDTRVSLTFRKTFKGPCSCPYPAHCDRDKHTTDYSESQGESSNNGSDLLNKIEEKAALLESKLVHQVYEEIASHFSETRHKPWPRVLQYLETIQREALVLDLGCGNGKYLGQGDSPRWEIGADHSANLLGIVIERGHQAIRCSLLAVPLLDSSVGGILCIATLHHLSTEERRCAALKEMCRVLVTGGTMLIYVWAKDQKKQNMSSYLKQNKKNLKKMEEDASATELEIGEFGLPVHVNRTQFQQQDNLVPWKLKKAEDEGGDQVYMRYYHVFEEEELEALVGKIDGLKVEDSYYDQGNWCVIARKCAAS